MYQSGLLEGRKAKKGKKEGREERKQRKERKKGGREGWKVEGRKGEKTQTGLGKRGGFLTLATEHSRDTAGWIQGLSHWDLVSLPLLAPIPSSGPPL